MAEETQDERNDSDEDIQMDHESIDKIIEEVEENPPQRLEDWPGGKAKYRTIGGGDANEAWEEGPTAKLGPSDLRYHDDGSITIKGEKVDNPDDYKGDPIPGGPTDPDAPPDPDAQAEERAGDGE